MRTLYVGGLSPGTDSNALKELFGRFGEVSAARIVSDPSGGSRGFAYVVLGTVAAAERARRELNGSALGGAVLRVAVAA